MTNRSTRDAGDTLIEVLIAIALVGVMATGILAAMATAVAGSGSHQDEAYAQSLAVAASERVQDTTVWAPCAQTTDYVSAAQAAFVPANFPASWTNAVVSVASVQYWTAAGWTADRTQCVDAGNPNGLAPVPNGGLQLVTVSVTSPDNHATETVTLIKRKSS